MQITESFKNLRTSSIQTDNIELSWLPINNINDVGDFVFSEDYWKSGSPVSLTEDDQFLFNEILYNNLDLISTDRLLDRIKNYENEFRCSSEDFFERWIRGEVESSPKIHDWMNTYQNLFKVKIFYAQSKSPNP